MELKRDGHHFSQPNGQPLRTYQFTCTQWSIGTTCESNHTLKRVCHRVNSYNYRGSHDQSYKICLFLVLLYNLHLHAGR